MADFYEILGVSKGASSDEIKRAYRKLAQEHHPDKTGGADAKFREINQAYQVLADAEKRRQYDQFGTTFEQAGAGGGDPFADFARGFGGFSWQQGAGEGFGFDFGDIFSDIFGDGGSGRCGGRQRGVDLEMVLDVNFLEAVFGVEKEISLQKKDVCPACEGAGAKPGTKLRTCSKCHGAGKIRRVQRTILGNISSQVACDLCGGRGKLIDEACEECKGRGVKQQLKTVRVMVPPGIDDEQRIRLSGQGEAGYDGSRAGDLYVRIRVGAHPTLKREGFNILSEVPVSFYQAALGTRAEVETVDGGVELKIPSGTQSGKVFRLRGKGVPHLNSRARGDHLVTVRVVTPGRLTKKEKEILQRLAAEKGELVDVKKWWDIGS